MTAATSSAKKVSGGHARENDIRWTQAEWADVARLAARRIATKEATEPLGEVLHAVQKSAVPSRRWKPLDELSGTVAQTKFYAACKRNGYVVAERPPRMAGVKAVAESVRWTERESLLVLRRYLHLEKVAGPMSATERLDRAQNIELPEDRRFTRRGTLSAMLTKDRFEPLKNNLWLLDKVPFVESAATYEEANGKPVKVVKAPTPAPTEPAAAAPVPSAVEALAQALPPLPPPIPPAAITAAIPAPTGPALDGLASGIASALNTYIATRDAAITAHVMQSIAAGPIAGAIAAHITHALAGTIAEAVNTVVAQIVPRIVAAELAAGVKHIAQATGPIQGPAAPKPEGEPPPVVEAQPAAVEAVAEVAPVQAEPVEKVRGPKHDPSPVPTPGAIKRLRVDLVGTERMGAVRAVMTHLNGSGRYVDLHAISQDQANYRPNKGTPVVVFNNFASHALTTRIRASGAEMHLAGGGMLGAAKIIKQILKDRGILNA